MESQVYLSEILMSAGLLLTYLIFIGFSIFLFIIILAARWKVFTKAGEKGWYSIIPIYNLMVLAEIAGLSGLHGLLAFFINLIPIIGFVFSIILYANIFYNLSKRFDVSSPIIYTIGLILFAPIFWIILGFGKSKYIGPHYKERYMKQES
ncbi:MAG: hypothetical protein GX362_06725 [Methanosarcinaceae archaeon]|nr:hypothetical protein [Methanosarcinaceae archaeon]